MTLRRLPETLVNRIAAGEVVERPAAAVKELVENAIDAGAGRIEVVLRDGGRAFVAVTDDGCGMTPEELELAVERHATSKLPDDDLVNIATLGFRGEALPSIGAVSRLTVASRAAAAAAAWSLAVEGGRKGRPQPAALSRGTRVEVRDLFFATPARLKFLKSPRTETNHVLDALRRLAMAHPEVGFSLAEEGRSLLDLAVAEGALFEARLGRLAAIMGRDFGANALAIEAEREGLRLTGYIGLPTLNRGNAQHQYLFVNGRPVRDRLLHGALRGAYQDFLARDRHPLVALFLELPPEAVDVNVHPAKTEVRFREPGLVRGLLVSACKHALAGAGHRASTTVAEAALGAFAPRETPGGAPQVRGVYATYGQRSGGTLPRGLPQGLPRGLAEAAAEYHAPLPGLDPAPAARSPDSAPLDGADAAVADYPLGAARAQLHATYIVAQTGDGIVIVDQHAAHERLVYERMKRELAARGVDGACRRAVRDRTDARALRTGRRGGARGAGPARRGRRAGLGARSRRRAGRAGRNPGAQGTPGGGLRHPGLPRLGARRAAAQRRGNERPAAPDGGDAPFRPVQPRPADLRGAQARRYRTAVRAQVVRPQTPASQ
jgi:DNA mismatch repair protein MutL